MVIHSCLNDLPRCRLSVSQVLPNQHSIHTVLGYLHRIIPYKEYNENNCQPVWTYPKTLNKTTFISMNTSRWPFIAVHFALQVYRERQDKWTKYRFKICIGVSLHERTRITKRKTISASFKDTQLPLQCNQGRNFRRGKPRMAKILLWTTLCGRPLHCNYSFFCECTTENNFEFAVCAFQSAWRPTASSIDFEPSGGVRCSQLKRGHFLATDTRRVSRSMACTLFWCKRNKLSLNCMRRSFRYWEQTDISLSKLSLMKSNLWATSTNR